MSGKPSSIQGLCLALTLLAALGGGLSGCLGMANRTDAVVGLTDGEALIIMANCPAASAYLTEVEPVFQQQCASCHNSGGGGFQMVVGTTLTESQKATNYVSAKSFLATDDGGDPNQNPILGRPLARLSHPVTVFSGETDPNYGIVRGWVESERLAPCGSGLTLPSDDESGEEEEEF